MSLFKKIYYEASSMLPTGIVKSIAPVSPLLPYHHIVSNENAAHVLRLYPYKNVKQFSNDLDFLLKHFKPISANEVANTAKRAKACSNSFLLTFDDGFREVYDIVAPILLQKGVPAVFFVNPAFIDNKELFYRSKISLIIDHLLTKEVTTAQHQAILQITGLQQNDNLISFLQKITQHNKHLLDDIARILEYSFTDFLKEQQPFLTHQQLNTLAEKGFAIGAHSWDHPYYHLLSEDEQLQQTISSGEYVRTAFKQQLKLFSFPHYDTALPQSFFNRLIKEWNPDLLFGIQNQKDEPVNKMLHRFNAERPDLPIRKQINGILLLHFFRKLLGKNNVVRSNV